MTLLPQHTQKLIMMSSYLSLFALLALFIGEFILSVTSHCLTERLVMCHTLLLMLVAGRQLTIITTNNTLSKPDTSSSNDRRSIVWHFVCSIAGEGLVFVNLIHAIRMLIHRHDSGVHHTWMLFGMSLCDVPIKLIVHLTTQCVHDSLMPLSASLMLTAMLPATVLAIVTAQLTIDETSPIVLYGDPSLTIIASIAFAALLIPPILKHVPMLLLDVPDGFDMIGFKSDIANRFPNTDCHELHVYRASERDFDVSLHIRQRHQSSNIHQQQTAIVRIMSEVRSVLARAGARRITLQPELLHHVNNDVINVDRQCLISNCDHDCIPMQCCTISDNKHDN